MALLIYNTLIINEGESFSGAVLIKEDRIEKVFRGEPVSEDLPAECQKLDADGKWLIPGVIDDQVHFREPGLTHKGNINSESRAAVAGGVTSFMDMPNTMPLTTTIEALEAKYALGAERSLANYSFYIGATNNNLDELLQVDPTQVCGVKVFMGSSTGNMLVDNKEALANIFAHVPMLIATHSEDEETIQSNKKYYKELYGDDLPVKFHPLIRSDEACYKSSSFAIELAEKHNGRLHVLHISSAREMDLFRNDLPLEKKMITAEVCVHHLWFSDADYEKYGNRIKWNPAIKTENDRLALIEALKNGKIDVVATDHAPHLTREKEGNCLKAASGGPLIQHSLTVMLEMSSQGVFSKEFVVDKMCHAPARLYRVKDRGFIREGFYADLVLVDPKTKWTVEPENILYFCGWSPFEGSSFSHKVLNTWVNGELVYDNGKINEESRGRRLSFDLFK